MLAFTTAAAPASAAHHHSSRRAALHHSTIAYNPFPGTSFKIKANGDVVPSVGVGDSSEETICLRHRSKWCLAEDWRYPTAVNGETTATYERQMHCTLDISVSSPCPYPQSWLSRLGRYLLQ